MDKEAKALREQAAKDGAKAEAKALRDARCRAKKKSEAAKAAGVPLKLTAMEAKACEGYMEGGYFYVAPDPGRPFTPAEMDAARPAKDWSKASPDEIVEDLSSIVKGLPAEPPEDLDSVDTGNPEDAGAPDMSHTDDPAEPTAEVPVDRTGFRDLTLEEVDSAIHMGVDHGVPGSDRTVETVMEVGPQGAKIISMAEHRREPFPEEYGSDRPPTVESEAADTGELFNSPQAVRDSDYLEDRLAREGPPPHMETDPDPDGAFHRADREPEGHAGDPAEVPEETVHSAEYGAECDGTPGPIAAAEDAAAVNCSKCLHHRATMVGNKIGRTVQAALDKAYTGPGSITRDMVDTIVREAVGDLPAGSIKVNVRVPADGSKPEVAGLEMVGAEDLAEIAAAEAKTIKDVESRVMVGVKSGDKVRLVITNGRGVFKPSKVSSIPAGWTLYTTKDLAAAAKVKKWVRMRASGVVEVLPLSALAGVMELERSEAN